MDRYRLPILAIFIVILIPVITHGVTTNCDEEPGDGDQGTLAVSYAKKRKGHRTVEDAKTAIVEWKPTKRIHDCYDLSGEILKKRVQSSDTWEKGHLDSRAATPVSYKWTIEVLPCITYEFQLDVPAKHRRILKGNLVSNVILLEPMSNNDWKADYQPQAPTNLRVVRGVTDVKLHWNKSPCADEYHIYVEEVEKANKGTEASPDHYDKSYTDSITMTDLRSCTNYDVQVVPNVGGDDGEYGEDLTGNFATNPDTNSAQTLDLLDLTSDVSSVELQFSNDNSGVNCFKRFAMRICRDCKLCTGQCKTEEIVVKRQFEPIRYKTDHQLKHCTNYNLEVTPRYNSPNKAKTAIVVEAKVVSFQTKFDNRKTEEIVRAIEPDTETARIILDKVDCLETYSLTYCIVGGTGNKDKDCNTKEGKMDGGEIIVENLTHSSEYTVDMTFSYSEPRRDSKMKTPTIQKTFRTLVVTTTTTTTTTPATTTKEARHPKDIFGGDDNEEDNEDYLSNPFEERGLTDDYDVDTPVLVPSTDQTNDQEDTGIEQNPNEHEEPANAQTSADGNGNENEDSTNKETSGDGNGDKSEDLATVPKSVDGDGDESSARSEPESSATNLKALSTLWIAAYAFMMYFCM